LWPAAVLNVTAPTETFRQPQVTNQQTSNIIRQTREEQLFKDTQIKQPVNPPNLELIRSNYIRKAEQRSSEQQIPSSKQPVHLMMAS
jgi:hypothetical protein